MNIPNGDSLGCGELVNCGCFVSSRSESFHCNAMRKSIGTHMNWHKIQQIEHTPRFHRFLTRDDLENVS